MSKNFKKFWRISAFLMALILTITSLPLTDISVKAANLPEETETDGFKDEEIISENSETNDLEDEEKMTPEMEEVSDDLSDDDEIASVGEAESDFEENSEDILEEEMSEEVLDDEIPEDESEEVSYDEPVDKEAYANPSDWAVFTYSGFQITGLANGHKEDTEITIPYDAMMIGTNAFKGTNVSKINYQNNPSTGEPNLTVIGEGAFKETQITEIVIPEKVTTIGKEAYYNCSNAKKVIIKTTKIGEGNCGISIFQKCTAVTEVDLPDNLTSIGSQLFYGAEFSTGISVPSTVISIGSSAFYQAKLSYVVFEEASTAYSNGFKTSLTTIGTSAFAGAQLGDVIVLPESLNSFGQYAFSNSTGLFGSKEFVIPSGVTSIGGNAFLNCKDLTSVVIESKAISSCGDGIWTGCTSLTSLTLQEGMTFIPTKFMYGANVSSTFVLHIPYTVTSIGTSAFANSDIKKFVFDDNDKRASNSTLTIGDNAFQNGKFSTFALPECTTSIGMYAFSGSSWEKITIPSKVTSLGNYAFSKCAYATEININSNKITSCGTNVFEVCDKVVSVNLADNMTIIPANLFHTCYFKTKVIEIPDNVTTIGSQAFFKANIEGLSFGENSKLTYIQASAFERSTITSTRFLPKSLDTIGDTAFKECVDLIDMVIPENVTTIGGGAFGNCGSTVRSLEIKSAKITSCGQQIFYHDGYFTELILSEDMTYIPENLFRSSELSSCGIDIPKKCQRLCRCCFYDSGITRINFPELTAKDLENPEITGVTTIDDWVFAENLIVEINLPSTVKSIGSYAFYNCDALKSIVIPEGCTSIGNTVFDGSQYLIHLTLPDSLSSIGEENLFANVEYDFKIKANPNSYAGLWATQNGFELTSDDYHPIGGTTSGTNIPAPASWDIFEGRNGAIVRLKNDVVLPGGELIIPNDCYAIAEGAFKGRTDIQKLTFQTGSKLELISASAFENCTGIKSVSIPENVTFLGGKVFKGCSGLERIEIKSGVLCYEDNLSYEKNNFDNFVDCPKVNEIIFSDNMTKIPGYLFYMESSDSSHRFRAPSIFISDSIREIQTKAFYQSGIGMIYYGDHPSLERIESYAFYYGTMSSTIELSDSLKGIGDNAFQGCTSLESITLPKSLVGIEKKGIITALEALGKEAFKGCTALKTIKIKTPFSSTSVVDESVFSGCTNVSSVEFDVDENVPIYIPNNLFRNALFKSISFVIPSNVVYIGDYSFYSSGFKAISIENVNNSNLKTIGKYAFSACAMDSFELPNSLETLGDYAFSSCSLLQTINVPKNVKIIGTNAFAGCNGAKTLKFDAVNVEKCAYDIFKNCTAVSTIQFGSSVTSIPDYLFKSAVFKTTSIVIPAKVKTIGQYAFTDSSFQSVTFEASSELSKIGNYAFSGCKFASFTIPATVKTLGNNAFERCTNLTSIEIPTTLTEIGSSAFSYCTKVESITINATNLTVRSGAFANCTAVSRVTFSNQMTYIPDYMFQNAQFKGVEVTIPSSVTVIGQSAFENSGIKSFNFESDSKLEKICTNAFYKNSALTQLDLPDSVNNIMYGAFAYCTNLKNFTVPSSMKTFNASWFDYDSSLLWVGIPASVGSVTNKDNHQTSGFSGRFNGCASGLFIKTSKDSPAYHWAILNGYTVEIKVLIDYHLSGGQNSSNNPTMYSPNDGNIIFENPQTRKGYTFDGWYSDEGCTKRVYGTGDYSIKETTEKIDVYAKWIKHTYKIEYDYSGMDDVLEPIYSCPKTYTASDTVVIPEPERYGFTFTGWDVYQNGVVVLHNIKKIEPNTVAGDIVLRPTWEAENGTYAIILNPNGGEGTEYTCPGIRLHESFEIRNEALGQFSKEGYFISEWNTKQDGKGDSYYDGEVVKDIASRDGETINLYAVWEQENALYNIVYVFADNLDVTANANPDTRKAGTAVKLKKPTVKGYVFNGWFADEAYTQPVTSIGKTEVGNKVLFASCTPISYTVTFNGNGTKTGTTESIPTTYDVDITLPENGFSRPGYTFVGWNTKANGTGDAYAVNAKAKNLSAKKGAKAVLYAQWKVEEYTVTYDVDGGETIDSAKYTTAKALSLPKPVKEGYTFAGWFADEAKLVKVKSIPKGSTGNKILYAKWTENSYTVKFNTNGGSGKLAMSSFSAKYSQEFCLLSAGEASSVTKAGCTFNGWNTAKDGSGEHFDGGESVSKLVSKAKGSLTLYAEWVVGEFIVNYNVNGGKGSLSANSVNAAGGSKINLITAEGLTKKGYTFKGWNTAKNGKGKNFVPGEYEYNDVAPKSGATKLTLYANWAADEYTIAYNNGGSLPASATFVGVKGLKLPTPKMTGYTFAGWYSDSDCTKKVKSIAKNTFEDKVVYAKWTENKYTLTLNANGGKAKTSKVSMTYTNAIKVSKDIVKRDGYTFKGFALKKNAAVPDYVIGDTIKGLSAKKNGKVTLYAIWQLDVHKITYNLNGGSYNNNGKNPLYCSVAKDVTLKAPVREGYKFAGWYCEQLNTAYPVRISKIKKSNMKSFYKNGAPVDITLKAMWIEE